MEEFRHGSVPGYPWVPGELSSFNLLADASSQITSQWVSAYSDVQTPGPLQATVIFEAPGGQLTEVKIPIGVRGRWNAGVIQGIGRFLPGTGLSLILDPRVDNSTEGYRLIFQRDNSKFAVAVWSNQTGWKIGEEGTHRY